MRITLICLPLFLSTLHSSYGQIQTVLNRDSVVFMRSLGAVSRLIVLQDNSRQAKYRYYYYLNNVKTDSTNTPIQYNFYNRPEGEFYFTERRDEEIVYYKISEQGKLLEFLRTNTRYVGIIGNEMIGVDQNSYERVEIPDAFGNVSGGMKPQQKLLRKIVAFNIIAKSKRELFDLDKLKIPEEEDIIDLFFFTNSNKVLFTTGIYESGGQPLIHVFELDINTNKALQKHFPDQRNYYDEKYKTWSLNYLAGYDITGKYILIDDYILSRDFNMTSMSVEKSGQFVESCLDHGKDFFWVPSKLDSRKKTERSTYINVWIPYRISIEVESNLYKIFNNQPMEKKDLTKMRKEDLNLLKNMVFAKHNYQFDSEYYQAFFNLFNFYNNPKLRKERTKEVSKLLTEADKRNLSLVTQQLSRTK